MENLTLENARNWKYSTQADLSEIDNLKAAHDDYEFIELQCSETIAFIAIRKGEIYKKAKVELIKDGKKVSNKEIGSFFNKSEATIRNYIKIFDNKELVMATPSPELLNVRNIIAIIDGRAKQNKDGCVETDKKTPEQKKEAYIVENKTLKEENRSLKSKIKDLEKQLLEANKIKDKISSMMKG
jgi:hypothetical protein